VALDDPEIEYWERVADEGDVEAMRRVAYLLRESDPSGSLRWLRRAADSGDPVARFNLGVRLAASDPAEAARWYRLAAEAGSVEAMYNLGRLLRTRDRRESRRWLEQAVVRNQADAMFSLAMLLRWRRPRGSLRWSRRAADEGSVHAMNWLASRAGLRGMTSFGANRRRFMNEHVDLLHKAADLGSSEAMCRLGFHYEAQHKKIEARRWYQAAADRGHDTARRLLDGGITGRRFLPLMRSYRQSHRSGPRNPVP
jgi:TPR repeat protein